MVEYTLRPATAAEASQIKDLIHLVGINPTGLDWERFVVAVISEGQVIGCGQLKPHGRDILELASIAVSPAYRGLGIARAVIERLLQTSQRPLYLMCMSDNGPLYEKFGFQTIPAEQMPRYFQRIARLYAISTSLIHREHELLVMKLE